MKDLFTLKDESSSLEDRSSGITETGEVLGGGVVEPASLKSDSNEKAVADANENKDTLKAVLRSKGLAGIFDHDFATDPSARTGDELESEAQLVAKRAAGKNILFSIMLFELSISLHIYKSCATAKHSWKAETFVRTYMDGFPGNQTTTLWW